MVLQKIIKTLSCKTKTEYENVSCVLLPQKMAENAGIVNFNMFNDILYG